MRRRAVLTAAGAVTVPLAGCSTALTDRDEALTLVLRNYTAKPQSLQLELLTPEGSDTGDARVMRREFEVPAPAEGASAGVTRQPDVAPYGRYIVRVRMKSGRGEWEHHHFVPDSTDAGEIDVGIYRADASGELYTRFF